MRQFPDGEVLVSKIEHDSVLEPAKLFKNREIPVTNKGIVDLQKFAKIITDKTVLVSVMMVNNELGTIQPIREIAEIIKNIRKLRISAGNKHPLYLHTDAAQAGNFLDLHTSRLGVDMMSINGGKIYGPKQSGALFVKAGVVLQPLIVGGGQERGLRSGTENIANIIGLAAALNLAQDKKAINSKSIKQLRDLFVEKLSKEIPSAAINGYSKHQAPHILHVTFPGVDNERVMMELDENGVQCAVGSACSASSTKPSHVLAAIGMGEELARSSLRFSFGMRTAKKDILHTVKILRGIVGS
jgi:cysteine desulfurase